jgi:hypothetical protein
VTRIGRPQIELWRTGVVQTGGQQGATGLQSKPLQRKVYFYRLRTEPDEQTGVPKPFNPLDACQAISDLPFGGPDGGRYLLSSDGNALCAWPTSSNGLSALRLGVVRRADLPRIEHGGQVMPLNIGPQQGLLEETHLLFLPDGVVGAEFNFYGPRASRLGTYLIAKCPSLPKVSFDLLVHHDMLEQVNRMVDVRQIHFSVRADYADLLGHASEDLPAAFSTSKAFLAPPVVAITWKVERHSRRGLGQRALDFLRRLVGEEQRVREGAEAFTARGLNKMTGKVESFDLLQDRLVSTQQVVRSDDRHRGVDHDSMFAAILAAYNALEGPIRRAAAVVG